MIFGNLSELLFSSCHWGKKLENVTWEISDSRRMVKMSRDVAFCAILIMGDFQPLELAMLQRVVWSLWARPVPCSALHFCLHPYIHNDDRIRHTSEKHILLYDRSCRGCRQKKSFHRNNRIKLLHKCKNQNKTETELKWWKSSAMLYNVKHTESHILLLMCQKLIIITGCKWCQLSFSSPFPLRLQGETSGRVGLTQKAAFSLKFLYDLDLLSPCSFLHLTSKCVLGRLKETVNIALSTWSWSEGGPPSSKEEHEWYHRRLKLSGKWTVVQLTEQNFALNLSKIRNNLLLRTMLALTLPVVFHRQVKQRDTKMNVGGTVLSISSRGCSQTFEPNNSPTIVAVQYFCTELSIRLWNTLRHLMVKKYFKGFNNVEDWVLFPRSPWRNVAWNKQLYYSPNKARTFSKWKFRTIWTFL